MPFACRAATLAMAVMASLTVAACDGPAEDPVPNTVGSLPEPSDPGTLLPVVVETDPPGEGTAPPGALFAGNFCSALTEDDIGAVVFSGLGRGSVTDVPTVALDGCSYPVAAGGEDFFVVVTARSQGDFAGPGTTDEVIDELSGIGDAARGVNRANGYEVYVKVPNGWFSVLTPDATSATALARRAAERADQG